MNLHFILKKPFVFMAIIFTYIALYQARQNGFFKSIKEKRTPSSCRAVLVKLNRRIPAYWKTKCEGINVNNLYIEISPDSTKSPFNITDVKKIRTILFRELANDLVLTSKNSPEDNLNNVFIVRYKLIHPLLVINAVTEGKYLTKFSTMKTTELILNHLQTTVKVQEILPQK